MKRYGSTALPRLVVGALALAATHALITSTSASVTMVQANEGIEMTRWAVRMASDRKLLAPKQFEFSSLQLNECGRMVCGWLKSRTSTNPPC